MDSDKAVKNQVILLMGKTGAGKSTFGNLLLGRRDGPFTVSDGWESETKKCQVETLSFHGNTYDIVDTPGMYDTRNDIDPLKVIANFVHKCAYGVRAIILVLKSERFTDEQRSTLNDIRTFLGKDARNNIIVVFSHANKNQIENKDRMQRAWNDIPLFSSFIRDIDSRWSISPHPDSFDVDRQISEERLMEIKNLISNIREIYTTQQLEENQRKLKEKQRKEREEAERKKKEYEDKIRAEAEKKTREEMEEKARQEREKARQEREELNQRIAKMEKEAKERASPIYIPEYIYIERENKESEKKVTSKVANVSKKEDSKVANVSKKEDSKVANVSKKEDTSKVANAPKKEDTSKISNAPKKDLNEAEKLGAIIYMAAMGATSGSVIPVVGPIGGGLAGALAGMYMVAKK